MEDTKLSPPWIEFFNEITALFEQDSAVTPIFSSAENTIRLYVEGEEKASALTQILPSSRTFGNVTVKILVLPANEEELSKKELFERAFDGNPAVSYIRTVADDFAKPVLTYVVFEKEVVQYFNDNLQDINGLRSTLYEDIAQNVFEDHDGVAFCTDCY